MNDVFAKDCIYFYEWSVNVYISCTLYGIGDNATFSYQIFIFGVCIHFDGRKVSYYWGELCILSIKSNIFQNEGVFLQNNPQRAKDVRDIIWALYVFFCLFH